MINLTEDLALELAPEERWWGGAVEDGCKMPFGATPHARDLGAAHIDAEDATLGSNQSAPLLISSAGRFVWADRPFEFAFDGDGTLEIRGTDVVVGMGGTTMRSAFTQAARQHFPASGRSPAPEMFRGPQYNTWIEMPYNPCQDAVLHYARDALAAGFPPGVLMIDDRWSQCYGDWSFDPSRFPDPQAMVEELHELGYSVMLWLVPFLSPDSENFRKAQSEGWLIRTATGRPAIRRWWNGYSAVVDIGNPEGADWLRSSLQRLQAGFGIDGFKFDAGDFSDYRDDDVTFLGGTAVDQSEAWARFAGEFSFNELRACWKMGGKPLAQRLHDKQQQWGSKGLASLIPESIAQGLIGHPFNCPDMIGGGDVNAVTTDAGIDQELFVRFAQCAALFPMMQFSLAPWRVLDDEHLSAVHAALRIREHLLPVLEELWHIAATTGEPILRSVGYHFDGFENVDDAFLLGHDILVAPILERGAAARIVQLPPGRWLRGGASEKEDSGEVVLAVSLETLPWWRRVVEDTDVPESEWSSEGTTTPNAGRRTSGTTTSDP